MFDWVSFRATISAPKLSARGEVADDVYNQALCKTFQSIDFKLPRKISIFQCIQDSQGGDYFPALNVMLHGSGIFDIPIPIESDGIQSRLEEFLEYENSILARNLELRFRFGDCESGLLGKFDVCAPQTNQLRDPYARRENIYT